MGLSGLLGRLFVAQGVLGLLMAVAAHDRELRGPTWTLTFLGVVLLSTGIVLWAADRVAAARAKRAEWTAHQQRRARERSDWVDQ